VSDIDASVLENREIPKVGKFNITICAENVPETVPVDTKPDQPNKKTSKTKLRNIRRRAKCREVYLAKLQQLGKYDPARPVKPDAER
jgi:hypothetical protein